MYAIRGGNDALQILGGEWGRGETPGFSPWMGGGCSASLAVIKEILEQNTPPYNYYWWWPSLCQVLEYLA